MLIKWFNIEITTDALNGEDGWRVGFGSKGWFEFRVRLEGNEWIIRW